MQAHDAQSHVAWTDTSKWVVARAVDDGGTVPYGASAKDCASTRQSAASRGLSAEQPANRLIFSSPVRDPTLDKVQTTVPCHALFGPSQSVGE